MMKLNFQGINAGSVQFPKPSTLVSMLNTYDSGCSDYGPEKKMNCFVLWNAGNIRAIKIKAKRS